MFFGSIAIRDGILFCGLTNSLSIEGPDLFASMLALLSPPESGSDITFPLLISALPPVAGLDMSLVTSDLASFFLSFGLTSDAVARLSFAKLIGSRFVEPPFISVNAVFFFLPL